ncbi:MAG: c-type cytochrome [Planctomycetes bacterium]|nr:c-type cytochrome [Planctomycetota bacterium]
MRFLLILTAMAALVSSSAVRAEDAKPPQEFAHPVVPAFERLTAARALEPVAGGRLLLGELGCVACHRAGESAPSGWIDRKQAPVLDSVGRRVRVEHLRAFLADPQGVKPGTTMPNLFAALPADERNRRVEALVHFLATTGNTIEQAFDRKQIPAGQKLFHEVGCTACHAPQVGEPLRASVSVPLGNVAEKYTVGGLTEFLKDPLAVRPSGRMPGPVLTDDEIRDVVAYLFRDREELAELGRADLPKISYRYYEGSWQQLPDFSKLEPKAQGLGAALDVNLARRSNNFGLLFEGWFHVEHAGEYSFDLRSDDGSKLFIDDKLVVNNDGIHAPETKSGRAKLEQGIHRMVAEVFNLGGGVELEVTIAGPGLRPQPLATLLASSKEKLLERLSKKPDDSNDAPKDEPGVFRLDPAMAQEGRKLFSSVGCAACHELKENGQPIPNEPQQSATELAQLGHEGGCLSEAPAFGLPHYILSDSQRTALSAALATAEPIPADAPTPDESIRLTMTRLSCIACHTRGELGGVEQARNALFHTTQQEMGDEGRIPPHLNGVGAKLTDEWLKNIASNGSTDRPYMLTRMPKFGLKNVQAFVTAVQAIDSVEPVEPAKFEMTDARVKAIGREMAGDRVFGCVKCHNFREHKATGVQSIDMTIMTRRLRRDWFHRYMLNPQAYRPGTRMPAAWPQGRSTLRDVLDGDARAQVEALWMYLSDGPEAGIPYGLLREAIELAARDEAVMYRNFIRGVGPRAIGVGYPEGANLAFDAGEMRLALIWQGAFIDASMHWLGRGQGFQRPLGDVVLALPDGPSFARLQSVDAPWPTKPAAELGYDFEGYRLSKDRRPTFQYELGDTEIEDFPTGVAGEKFPSIRRTLTVKAAAADTAEGAIFYRAAAAAKIEPLEEGLWQVGENLKVRLKTDAAPVLQKIGDRMELRVPLPDGRESVIVQDYLW